MPFKCGLCDEKLADNYIAGKPITQQHHGQRSKCDAIGTTNAYHYHEEAKSQVKTRERVTGVARGSLHKANKSESNFVKGQTPVKDNKGTQAARQVRAREQGVSSHFSRTSASTPNGGASRDIRNVNHGT